MFESWISDLLASSLGHFIDVKTDQLKISLWKGMTIENARLREDAFDHLQLPFRISHGSIDKLHVQVPWSALSFSPSLVSISGIRVQAEPFSEWRQEESLGRSRKAKRSKIVAAEFARVSKEQQPRKNFLWRIGARIWNSVLRQLKLEIDSVVVSFSGQRAAAYRFGLQIDRISTVGAAEVFEYQPRAISQDSEILKSLFIEGLSIFWIPDCRSEKLVDCLVLNPTDCQIFLYLQSQTDSARGLESEAHLRVEQFRFNLSDRQLISIASFLDDLSVWQLRSSYAHFRPEEWVTRSEAKAKGSRAQSTSSRRLWVYAIRSVIQDIRQSETGFSRGRLWNYLCWGNRYIPQYMKKIELESSNQIAEPDLIQQLEQIELEMPVDAIMRFRSIAERESRVSLRHSKGEGGWIKWGVSSALQLFQSRTEIEPLIARAPVDEDVAEIYSVLEESSGGSSQLVSLSVEIGSIALKFVDCADPIFRFLIGRVESHFDVFDDSVRSKTTIGDFSCHNLIDESTKMLWTSPRAAGSALIVDFDSSDAALEIEIGELKIIPDPVLVHRLIAIGDGMPKATLSTLSRNSSAQLPSKRSRVIAQLPQKSSLNSISLKLASSSMLIRSRRLPDELIFETRTLSFKWTRTDSDRDSAIRTLRSLDDSGIATELIEQLIYSKWTIAVTSLSIKLNSDPLLHPLSASANLKLNVDVQEDSLPMATSDWRLAETTISISMPQISSLFSLVEDLANTPDALDRPDYSSLSSDGPDRISLDLNAKKGQVEVRIDPFFQTSLCDVTAGGNVDFSLFYPKLRLTAQDVTGIDDQVKSVFAISTQSGSFRAASLGIHIEADCSITSAMLQDNTNYATYPPISPQAPRLGRSITVKEIQASLTKKTDTRVTAVLSGVESNGYITEPCSSIQSNRKSNTITFNVLSSEEVSESELRLDHATLGSTFLVRLFGFLGGPSERLAAGEPLKVQRVSTTRFWITDSCLAFPSKTVGDCKTAASAILSLPEFDVKIATAEATANDQEGSAKWKEIEDLKVENLRLLAAAGGSREDGCLLLPVMTLSHISFSSSSNQTRLAGLIDEDISGRIVDYKADIRSLDLGLSEDTLVAAVSSLSAFLALHSEVFGGEEEDMELDCTARVDLGISEVSMHTLGSTSDLPSVFCLMAKQVGASAEIGGGSQSASVGWEDLRLMSVKKQMEIDAYSMKADGLWLLSTGDEVLVAEQRGEAVLNDEEDSGSVSSSTSWQTAGSQVSTVRRPSQTVSVSTDFQSVEETRAIVGRDSPGSSVVDSGWIFKSEEEDPEVPVPALMVAKVRSSEPIKMISVDNLTRIEVGTVYVDFNVSPLCSVVARTESLVRAIGGEGASQDDPDSWRGVLELKLERLCVSVLDVDVSLLAEFDPNLPIVQSEATVDSVFFSATSQKVALSIKAVQAGSRWVRLDDPAEMNHEVLRKLEPLLKISNVEATLYLPDKDIPWSPLNKIDLSAEAESIAVDVSLEKIRPLRQIARSLMVDRGQSGVPSVDNSTTSLLSNPHFHVSLEVLQFSICAINDFCNFAFPLARGAVRSIAFDLESLATSEVLVWQVLLAPEVEVYNRRSLGWECLLAEAQWSISGRSLLSVDQTERLLSFSSIELSTDGPIEATLTPGMIQAAVEVSQSIAEVSMDEMDSSPVPLVSFWLKNQSGSDVECWLSNEESPFVVRASDIEPIYLDKHATKPDRRSETELRLDEAIDVDCDDIIKICSEEMNRAEIRIAFRVCGTDRPYGWLRPTQPGIVKFSIQSEMPRSSTETSQIRSRSRFAVLACKVEIRGDGGIEVAIRSDVRLINETAYRIEVGCWIEDEATPNTTLINPMDSFWVPIMTMIRGRITLRPHPVSSSRYPLRCAWSHFIDCSLIPECDSVTKLQCSPISGGIKPIGLSLETTRKPDGSTDITIKSPVIVHNYLPVPVAVSISCDGGITTALKGKLNPLTSIQGFTIKGEDITNLQLKPEGYKSVDHHLHTLPAPLTPIAEFKQRDQDLESPDTEIKIRDGILPFKIKHRVEGGTGRHVIELCTPIWIYNCTGIRLAVRAVKIRDIPDDLIEEEDVVPDRWISPFAEQETVSSIPAPSSTSGLGLRALLDKDRPEKVRLKSGSQKGESSSPASAFASMEICGGPGQIAAKLQFRTSGSQARYGRDYWTEGVPVDAPGGYTVVRCPHPMHATSTAPAFSRAANFLAVSAVSIPASGGCLALHVMPRFVLTNTTAFHFQYRQQGIQLERELPIDVTRSIHWPDASKPLLISLRVQEAGWMWSGGLVMDVPGDTIVKLRHRVREETVLVQMDVSLQQGGILLATLMHQSSGFAPYRLDNFTSEKIHVRQRGSGNQEDVLRPYSSMPYAWDEPSGKHQVVLEGPARKLIGVFKLDSVGESWRMTLLPEVSDPYANRTRRLKIKIETEGPTRVLSILDEDVHPEISIQPAKVSPKSSCKNPFVLYGSKKGMELSFRVPSFEVSLVSDTREMLFVKISEIALELNTTESRYGLHFLLKKFQADLCRRRATYPVLARGPIAMETLVGTLLNRKALEVDVAFWRRRPGGVLCIEKLSIDSSPFAVNIDEESFRPLIGYFGSFRPPVPSDADTDVHKPHFVLAHYKSPTKLSTKLKIYIEDLHVSRGSISFSFCPSGRIGPESGSIVQRFISLANFENALIRLSPLKMKHPLLSIQSLMTLIGRHYMTSLFQELYKVVGSAHILGDPVHLLHRLGLGVWLLFANPTFALVTSRTADPSRLAAGVMSGVTSLITNFVSGISNAVGKFSLAARRGLIVLLQIDPGAQPGSKDLIKVVLSSMVGVLSSAAEGLDSNGLFGFIKGTSKGLARLIAMPLAFLLELLADFAERVNTSFSGMIMQGRLCRVPRHISQGRPVQRSDIMLGIADVILEEALGGCLASETLLGCFAASEQDSYFVLTKRYLAMAKCKAPLLHKSSTTLLLLLPLETVRLIRMHLTEITVFGFDSSVYWNTKKLLSKTSKSPYLLERLKCSDIAVAFRLSVAIKAACDLAPRSVSKIGNGFRFNASP